MGVNQLGINETLSRYLLLIKYISYDYKTKKLKEEALLGAPGVLHIILRWKIFMLVAYRNFKVFNLRNIMRNVKECSHKAKS